MASSKKAGGGGKLSSLLIEVRGRLAFVIDEVRRIGGRGLLIVPDPRRSKVFRIVPLE